MVPKHAMHIALCQTVVFKDLRHLSITILTEVTHEFKQATQVIYMFFILWFEPPRNKHLFDFKAFSILVTNSLNIDRKIDILKSHDRPFLLKIKIFWKNLFLGLVEQLLFYLVLIRSNPKVVRVNYYLGYNIDIPPLNVYLGCTGYVIYESSPLKKH